MGPSSPHTVNAYCFVCAGSRKSGPVPSKDCRSVPEGGDLAVSCHQLCIATSLHGQWFSHLNQEVLRAKRAGCPWKTHWGREADSGELEDTYRRLPMVQIDNYQSLTTAALPGHFDSATRPPWNPAAFQQRSLRYVSGARLMRSLRTVFVVAQSSITTVLNRPSTNTKGSPGKGGPKIYTDTCIDTAYAYCYSNPVLCWLLHTSVRQATTKAQSQPSPVIGQSG